MKASADEKTSSGIVIQLYNRRKQVFVQSLQEVLIKIAQDKIVKQMLQDRTSGQFITKRLEEVVAQVIFDDREVYIDALIQKLNAYEKLYSKDQAQMIRNLGTQILTISDAQNAGEVHYVRQIQSLNEQVQALQAEIVTLRTQKADNEVTLSDLTKDVRVRTLDPDYNPNSPTFMHIFGQVDLTDYKVRLKLIHTDASTSRQLVLVLINKMKKIISIMKSKSKKSVLAYAKMVAEYQAQQKMESLKAKDIQHHYEDEIIPKLLTRHKESVAKHKKVNQEKQAEIDKLKTIISELKEDLKTSKSKEKHYSSETENLTKQLTEKDNIISNLRGELQKSVLVIQTQKNQVGEKERIISQLQDGARQATNVQNRYTKEIQSLQKELSDANAHIYSLEADLEKSKAEIPKAERNLKELTHQYEDAKQNNEELTRLADERQKTINELQRKLNKIEPQFASNQRELSDVKEELNRLKDDNIEKKHTIESLKHDLSNNKQIISRLEQTQAESKAMLSKNAEIISELEKEKDKHQNEAYDIKSQMKKFTTENARMEKQVKENTDLIEKQSAQIQQQKDENDNLKESLRKANNRCSQLESDIQRISTDLDLANSKVEDYQRRQEQQETKFTSARDENNEMKRKIRDLTSELKEKELKHSDAISDLESQNRNLQAENESINNKVNDLENQVRTMKKAKQQNEDQISSQERVINQLKQDNAILKEKNTRVSDKVKQNQENLGNLEVENQNFKNIFEEIQNIIPLHTLHDLPDVIRDYAENQDYIKQMCSILGTTRPSEAITAIKNMKENMKVMQKAAGILGTKNLNNLANDVQALQDKHEKLSSEHTKILRLLPDDNNSDLSQVISEIIEKQRKFEEQIDSAASFISQVLAAITGSPQAPLNFPLKKNISDQLLDIAKQIKTRADSDRKNINAILEKDKSLGYEGDDCMKACEFLAQIMAETERQKTFESVSKELDNERDLSRRREDILNSQIAKLKKKVQTLRSSLAMLQSQGTEREDELSNIIASHEKKIRELSEELETERRVREELGKIGDGFSADTKYLKSKLSAKELKFFTFIQKVMQQDKQTRELHMKMKQERENLLVDPNILSSKI